MLFDFTEELIPILTDAWVSQPVFLYWLITMHLSLLNAVEQDG